MFRLIILPVVLGIVFYFYFFFMRMCKTFCPDRFLRKERIVSAVLSVAVAALCTSISSIAVVIVLHVMVISAILMFVNFVLKKSFKEKYEKGFKAWKKIRGSEVISLVLTAVIISLGAVNMFTVRKTDYTIYTHKDIRKEGYRVALLADIHFGVSIDEEELSKVCERVSNENPHIVILGGDIVDDSTTPEEMKRVFEILGKIKSEYGIFYVFGNHDRPFSLLAGDFSEDELVSTIESNGIKILKDEIHDINEEFSIIGRDDKGYGDYSRKSIGELSKSVSEDKFILTLDHRPTEYEENGKASTDLLLSGHTHGGQLWPVNIIDNLFKINDANYGVTEIDEDTKAIVTSGVAGWAYPVKTSAPSEFVIIDIKKQ